MNSEITTERLRIPPATMAELDALIGGNRHEFERLIDASAPDPLEPPPETGDVLEWFRATLANDPAIAPWFFRWIIDRSEHRLVGSAGFSGYPDDEGDVLFGYGIYPADEGKGYATEAAAALVRWALAQEGVRKVRATIPTWHIASQRVSAKAGLTFRRDMPSDEFGTLQVWEVDRETT
jgi:[ribosomal protein S5]-alanine N-acetyltransferase